MKMNYEINQYKDGQVSAKIFNSENLHIKIRGNSYDDLFRIASIKEVWDYKNRANKSLYSTLTIYCLIGQRSDRRFNQNESFDLKVITNFINSLKFDIVQILKPHSSVALALINNSEELSDFIFVEKCFNEIGNPTLISPDAGAYKNLHSISQKLDADLIPSNKVRVNGIPKINIQGNVKDKKCLIVDDLADGGRTFKLLADELKSQGASKVFLFVTHAQFNYGFDELKKSIEHIYCTNSFKEISNDFVTQYKVI